MKTVDVVVVGAGPAGSAAAITLAEAGVDVLVVDKARFPRDKICGDGLTTGALRHLEELGLEVDSVGSWKAAQHCWIRSPAGRTTRFSMPDGPGHYMAVAPRRDLDSALVDLARKAGADVLDGHGVGAARELGDHVEVDVEGIGTVRARWAIAADGMWSPIRKQLGLSVERYRGEWHAFRQYVSGVGQLAARDLYISFDAGPRARLLLVLPTARRQGEHRLRHPTRRRTLDPGHEAALGGPAGSTARQGGARPGRRRRRAPQGVAHPRQGRLDAAHLVTHAVRR
ncbi:MAG: FAD-dependent oxidoreductase [Microthrixaceae bacterium]